MAYNPASIIFNTDSYKVSMWKQYPEGTEYVYSYISARNPFVLESEMPSTKVLTLGIKAFINDYLCTPVTEEDVAAADQFWTAHGEPFNREGWDYIVKVHKGNLPIKIKTLPEGTLAPVGVVVATVVNTDPTVPWITTWVETALLRAIWYPSAVATESYLIKQIIKAALYETGTPELLNFKLHDFGARGTTSLETAGLGGMAHLVNWMGTDTFSAIMRIMRTYGDKYDTIGFSIPAAEHSTITSWGKSSEDKAYANMINQFAKPGSIYAVVSDSYDIFQACALWSRGELKQKVINSGATLVIRPDSGDPTKVLPEMLAILEQGFGSTENEKGYYTLNHNVRVIWGDGINRVSIRKILKVLKDNKWSADMIAFGMGGALLQAPMRDDYGWAMKCSAIYVDGQWREVYKEPATSAGKASLKGRVTSIYEDGQLVNKVLKSDRDSEALVLQFSDGLNFNTDKFADVRLRAEMQ